MSLYMTRVWIEARMNDAARNRCVISHLLYAKVTKNVNIRKSIIDNRAAVPQRILGSVESRKSAALCVDETIAYLSASAMGWNRISENAIAPNVWWAI